MKRLSGMGLSDNRVAPSNAACAKSRNTSPSTLGFWDNLTVCAIRKLMLSDDGGGIILRVILMVRCEMGLLVLVVKDFDFKSL